VASSKSKKVGIVLSLSQRESLDAVSSREGGRVWIKRIGRGAFLKCYHLENQGGRRLNSGEEKKGTPGCRIRPFALLRDKRGSGVLFLLVLSRTSVLKRTVVARLGG